MNNSTSKQVLIGNSKIEGEGLFAQKDFKEGEIVLDWNPNNKYLSREELQSLSDNLKRYVAIYNDKYLLIAEPERYMNHSCNPNTTSKEGIDYALKDIKVREEITGDYENEGTLAGFECKCGSENCRKSVRPRNL